MSIDHRLFTKNYEPMSKDKQIKNIMLLSTMLLIVLPLNSCNVPPRGSKPNRQPIVRIGIVEQRNRVEFRIEERFDFRYTNGALALHSARPGRWMVESIDSVPTEVEYRLVVGTMSERHAAEEIRNSVQNKGVETVVKQHKIKTPVPLSYSHEATYQVLARRKFKSRAEAKAYQRIIRDKTNTELVAVPKGRPQGLLRFTNLKTGQSFESKAPVRIQAVEVELADVDVGSGYHWESTAIRRYNGIVEFILDYTGNITVVNYLQLENYIKGVVPSEMPASFPHEALKAQAVTARVEALAKIGLRHPLEPFDLCDDVHCQVFSGLSKQSVATDNAVESTRGIFMVSRRQLAEAFYAGVCGGHTENNDNVWVMNHKRYLRGVPDKAGRLSGRSLTREPNVKKWIDSKPDVYCNTNNKNVPKSVSYSTKYFRWQVEYSRKELEQIIREKTGEEFGSLVDLRPVKRGVSGRLIELEVIGRKKRFRIGKELAIRQALSRRTLYSACFYVKKVGKRRGLADKFIIKGAGWGHGVGMCQVGAAVMAFRGKKYDQILTHYYKGVFLDKLYK